MIKFDRDSFIIGIDTYSSYYVYNNIKHFLKFNKTYPLHR